MLNLFRSASSQTLSRGQRTLLAVAGAVAGLVWLAGLPVTRVSAQTAPKVVTDRTTYNVGDAVGLRVITAGTAAETSTAHYTFTLRYSGDAKPVAEHLPLGSAEPASPGYRLLWRVPMAARTGRYELDLQGQGATPEVASIASFVVHREVIHIISADVNDAYFTSGDSIGCSVRVENLSGHAVAGMRLEFSERYWPWIVQQRERVGTDITEVENGITLAPHQRSIITSTHCTTAASVKEPSIKQYSAVLWDRDRKNVYAIALSPLVFVDPPSVTTPRPYPPQFVYPNLKDVNTTAYREFHPEPYGADAIRFDTHHTMFPTGAEASIRFSLSDPTETNWRQVAVRARLLGPDGKELATQTVADGVNLNARGPKLTQEVKFQLPPDASGLFHAWVDIADSASRVIATNVLELGVNPLPRSVLLFAAHEDDDGTQQGFIRALVENQVPYHQVYLTSGDAGSCDHYFQHSCGPADALDFGYIRMQEARAAMGHLGVPADSIFFLGLPDGGTGKIWYDHWHSSDPYLAVLLASDHAPYTNAYQPNLPFARDAVLAVTEELIKKFRPDVVFTVHPPAEGHIDHIVNNYFVVKALQELLREGVISPDLELRVDRIFNPKEHPSTPYHYEDHEFYVSGEAMALAQEAGWFYQSQGGNRSEGNLRTWDKLKRTEGYRKVLDWKEHEGWNEKE